MARPRRLGNRRAANLFIALRTKSACRASAGYQTDPRPSVRQQTRRLPAAAGPFRRCRDGRGHGRRTGCEPRRPDELSVSDSLAGLNHAATETQMGLIARESVPAWQEGSGSRRRPRSWSPLVVGMRPVPSCASTRTRTPQLQPHELGPPRARQRRSERSPWRLFVDAQTYASASALVPVRPKLSHRPAWPRSGRQAPLRSQFLSSPPWPPSRQLPICTVPASNRSQTKRDFHRHHRDCKRAVTVSVAKH
jgi:hypothetical protein